MSLNKRSPGAQPGNTNAIKHGYYSRRFKNLEIDDLDVALSDGLNDEIMLLRVIIRRVFDYASDDEAQNVESWSKALTTLGLASTRLAHLIRTQKLIKGDDSEISSALSQAIGEVCDELGISKS